MAHGQPINARVVLQARRNLGMTLRELAEACERNGHKIDHSQLSKIERGRFRPLPPLLPALAKSLGIEVEDLFVGAADGNGDGAAA